MKKLLQLLVVCFFVCSCTKDTFDEQKVNDTDSRVAQDQFDNSYLGVYKGLFSTNDGLTRGSLTVTLLPTNEGFAQLTLSTGEIINLKSSKLKLTLDNSISALRFSSAGLSNIDASLEFSVEGDGINPSITNVNFDNKESDILVAKNMSRAPLTPITGTYVRTAGTGGFPTSGRTWNIMSIGAGDNQNFAVQIFAGGRIFNVPAANSTQTNCATAAGYTTCTVSGTATVLGYAVTWSGTHKYNPDNAGNSNQCAEVSGTWTSPYGNSSGTFVSDTNCSAPAVTNDTCATATSVGAGTYTGSNTNATNTGAPTGCANNLTLAPGVWYTYTTTTPKLVIVDTEGSTSLSDTILGVFSGSCGALTCVESDDDDGTDTLSTVTFSAAANVTYYFYVTGYVGLGSTGVGDYQLNVAEFVTPANDLCANAIPVTVGTPFAGYTTAGSNTGAPATNCNGVNLRQGPGVWHTYTNATGSSKLISVSTTGSNFTTRLGILSGTCGALTCVTASTASADLTFTAAANTTYRIYITAANNVSGNYNLTLTELFPPANDLCANAITMTTGQTLSGSTTNATATGAPTAACNSNSLNAAGIWYKFVSNSAQQISVDTEGSNFDTILGVYTGTCAGLTCLSSNDQNSLNNQSRVVFTTSTTVGTTYYFYVTGFSGARGNVTISVNNTFSTTTSLVGGQNLIDHAGAATNYSANRYDVYYIDAGVGKKAQVTFANNANGFSMENNFDFLKFYDGNSIASTPITVATGNGGGVATAFGFTGTAAPSNGNASLRGRTVTSTGRFMTVLFYSDYSLVSNGFAASITSINAREAVEESRLQNVTLNPIPSDLPIKESIGEIVGRRFNTTSQETLNGESEVESTKIFSNEAARIRYYKKNKQ